METTIKRLPAKNENHADQTILNLRRQGRSAWAEQDGNQHYIFIRLQVVQAHPSFLCIAHLYN